MQRGTPQHRGFNLIELAIVLLVIVLIAAVLLPSIQQTRSQSMVEGSMNNLVQLGISHALYSADWNGNQWTNVPHDIGFFANNLQGAFTSYCNMFPQTSHCYQGNFATWLGWAEHPASDALFTWYYPGGQWALPLNFDAASLWHGFGYFRMHNVKSFNAYVDGRVYSSTYYAPKDAVAIDAIGECWDVPTEFCLPSVSPNQVLWSSYSLSPAALYNPAVWSMPEGEFPQTDDAFFQHSTAFQVPSYWQALHPSRKTHIMEHHWLQNNDLGPCNPKPHPQPGDYDGCLPYLFNASIHSEPATLFYDLHVRLLPTSEVVASDMQTELWRRDTAWGEAGYFSEFGSPGPDNPWMSHHILTKNGIQGRDTLGPDVDISDIQFAAPSRQRTQAGQLSPSSSVNHTPDDASTGLMFIPDPEGDQ